MVTGGETTAENVVFLFTRFPVASETFLQREIQALHQSGLNFRIVSLWGGQPSWNGLPVEREGLLTALAGILWIPYYLAHRPGVFWQFLKTVWIPRSSGVLNWAENLLGAGYALRRAGKWKACGATHFHGVWASAPAMAAWFLSELSDIPFSFSGHAYDLFEKGGDGWIRDKIQAASWIRTSTLMGRDRLTGLGADPAKILVVRRGLLDMPERQEKNPMQEAVRFLSVGRMVEKMGFPRQIPLIRKLIDSGLEVTVDWIGDGPQRKSLEKAVRIAGLEKYVHIHGHLPYSEVESAYRKADCFLFTGQIDRNGDRAGLPNAIAEAMCWDVLVFSTRVGAVEEAIVHQETGLLWNDEPTAECVIRTLQNPQMICTCRKQARLWVENMFDLRKNIRPLVDRLSTVTFFKQEG